MAAARPSVELRPLIAAMVGSLANVAGLVSVPDDEIVVDDGQIGEGYGRATAAADEATRLLEPAA